MAVSLRVDNHRNLEAQDSEVRERVWKRQRRLLLLQRTALVYSPQVLLQGREFPDWSRPAFDAALKRIQARPPRARIAVEMRTVGAGRIVVVAQAQVLDAGPTGDSAALYLAPFERRGEERAVAEWLGPVAASPDGHISVSRTLALPSAAAPPFSGVVAFVEDRRTREVLQALVLPACSP